MNNIDNLIEEVKYNEMILKNTKVGIAKAIFDIYMNYLISINEDFYSFFWKKHNINEFLIKSKWFGVDEYSSGHPKIKVYYKKKLILNIIGTQDSYEGKYKFKSINKLDIERILELREFHNLLIESTRKNLIEKNSKIIKLNNFQLALKELEV